VLGVDVLTSPISLKLLINDPDVTVVNEKLPEPSVVNT